MKDGTKALEELREAYIDLFGVSKALGDGGWKATDTYATEVFNEKQIALLEKLQSIEVMEATEKERMSVAISIALVALSNVYTGRATMESVQETISVLVTCILDMLEISREELC